MRNTKRDSNRSWALNIWVLLPLTAIGCAGSSGDDRPAGSDDADQAPLSLGQSNRQVPRGEAIQFAAVTNDSAVRSVRFSLDGKPLAVCDASNQEDDCRLGNLWRVTTSFEQLGSHQLIATYEGAHGPVSARQTIEVVSSLPAVPDLSETDTADGAESQNIAPAAANRGFLDPNLPSHNIFGGIFWSVRSQTVIAPSITPSTSAARQCMGRYGASIRKWADKYKVSRGSVVATALAECNCTNPAGSSDGLSSGPMQVQGVTCVSVYGPGISQSECKARMHSDPDFSFEIGVRYIAGSFMVSQHHHDPPKIAAAYNAGAVYRSSGNRWHMLVTGNHIDRWVNGYNGYRAWEKSIGAASVNAGDAEIAAGPEPVFEGEHVERVEDLPRNAREGQTYFVGNWDMRNGDFAEFRNGQWTLMNE